MLVKMEKTQLSMWYCLKTKGKFCISRVLTSFRWWAGIGWQAIMLPHERKAWSDETGAITLPTKEHYRLPTVDDYQDLDSSETSVTGDFEWVDEWEIDYQWSDADTEGWTYCNQRWDNPRSYRVMNSFTRRRKWVRHMKLVPLLNKEE